MIAVQGSGNFLRLGKILSFAQIHKDFSSTASNAEICYLTVKFVYQNYYTTLSMGVEILAFTRTFHCNLLIPFLYNLNAVTKFRRGQP